MARYHGKSGAVYLSTSKSGTATSVPGMSEWTLDKASDKVDVTGFNDPNKQYVQGFADIKGTVSAWFEDNQDILFDAAESADGVNMYLYPSILAPGIFHGGPAWIDASISCPSGGAVSLKGNFVANGAWTRKP